MRDAVTALLEADARTRRTGSLSEAVFASLAGETLGEINRPFERHLERRALSFCRPEPPILYPQSASETAELWASGATATIQRLEQTNGMLRELCDGVGAALDRRIHCAMYISRGGGTSLSWHCDEWQVLAIQLYGRKTFHVDPERDDCFTLTPGTWLRLDPDEQHYATVDSALSVHLSIGALA